MRYVRPRDLDEALAEIGAGALPLAGGSVLVPLIARGELRPATVVDLGRVTALRELRDEKELAVGAAVTLEALQRIAPAGEAALPEAAAAVGNPLVRRVGTLGGNLASRLPQADLVPALLVLDAEVVWANGDGSQEHEAVEDAVREPPRSGRIITSVRIARDPTRRSGFVKFAWRRATGAAVASVAFAARQADGSIATPRLAVGGLAPPGRLPTAESALAGRPWADPPVEQAAAAAAEEAAARAGLEDPADPRRRLVELGVRELVARLVTA